MAPAAGRSGDAVKIFAISGGKRAFPAVAVPRLSYSASSVYRAMGNVSSRISFSFLRKKGGPARRAAGFKDLRTMLGNLPLASRRERERERRRKESAPSLKGLLFE